MIAVTTRVNGPRYQTTVPRAIREKLHIDRGSVLIWTIQSDGHVIVSTLPEDFSIPFEKESSS
ncbi:AbrB/MazE/SpoVT family DNA-binding domain-containing protein [Sulfobacillus thermosulfidooxidans]|uniref:AbrB/MazE/SpoVT family DNA-binding domain-containing protein n=1 Tax=Sulfobacillus thermosulfidooxidans TaxID=28034 RepID=UPI0009DA2D57